MIELQQTWMLPALIAIPFIAGLLCWLVERFNKRLPRWIALIGMTLTFALSLLLWQYGDYSGMSKQVIAPQANVPWVAEFMVPWIPSFGISFHLALDGLSLLMVGLFLFFFFWEMMLVPIYFLIAIWGHDVVGGKTKEYAATKFFIYTQASGLIMLVGILILVIISYAQKGVVSFNYNDLLGTSLGGWEYPIMLCFFIGFAVKLPIFPFHGWLPDAHAQAPTAGSVDLAGVLIKTAAYGLIRFVIPLFPAASQDFAPIAMTLGTIGIFYGAWLAFMQTDMKRLLAYTSISHMGFVVLAIYAGTLISLQGLMIQMLAHGLSSAALFIMAGQLYERLHTRDLTLMGGMWGQFRYYAPILMFFCAALLGIPGTGNFIGEFLILFGAFADYPVFVVFATFSLVLAGLYSLILIHRAMFGSNNIKEVALRETETHGLPSRPLKDLGKRELSLLLMLAAGLVWLGLYPQPFLDTSSHAMQWINNAYMYSQVTQVDASQLLDAMEAR